MRVLVCGGRKYADRDHVFGALDAVHRKHGITLIIEGGALGADRLGRAWAKSRGVPFETCEADWDRFGRSAGGIRNAAMLTRFDPQAVVAFAGKSGTADMVARAEAAHIPVWQVPPRIFVFGSNLAGRHGAGTAKTALDHYGAVYGRGEGMQGHAYAIPTKDGRDRANLRDPAQTLPLAVIAGHVRTFLQFAASRPGQRFFVTPIGCGLAGYKPHEIGPLFSGATPNVDLPPEFLPYVAR
jgi:hypothetical protein